MFSCFPLHCFSSGFLNSYISSDINIEFYVGVCPSWGRGLGHNVSLLILPTSLPISALFWGVGFALVGVALVPEVCWSGILLASVSGRTGPTAVLVGWHCTTMGRAHIISYVAHGGISDVLDRSIRKAELVTNDPSYCSPPCSYV